MWGKSPQCLRSRRRGMGVRSGPRRRAEGAGAHGHASEHGRFPASRTPIDPRLRRRATSPTCVGEGFVSLRENAGAPPMKFTLSWLKEHLDTTATAAEVVEAMTMAGLEVEHVEDPAARLAAFTVAHVLEAH